MSKSIKQTQLLDKVHYNTHVFQYITHVHFDKIKKKYVDANLDASDNAISDNESSSEMLTSQSQVPE